MKARFSLLAVAVMLGSVCAFVGTSIHAACSLRQQECYRVKPKCPVTQDTSCHQDAPGAPWFRVVEFYTHYACESTTSSVKDCDVDNNTMNNMCAKDELYNSKEDCESGTNRTGYSYRMSGMLCAGSDPC